MHYFSYTMSTRKYNFKSLLILLFLFTVENFQFSNCADTNKLDTPPTIGAYQKNFKGKIVKVISEKGNSEATLPSLDVTDHIWEGKSIQLDCNASYPVYWIYSGPGSPAVHVETFRQAPDFEDTETYRFSSIVTFTHTVRRQTGNYSCKSIEDPEVQTSIYLFVPGKRLFVNGPKEDANNVTSSGWSAETNGTETSWIILPCPIFVRDHEISLFKHVSGTVEKIGSSAEKSDTLEYDPKIGFSYKWDQKGKQEDAGPWGNYFCQGEFRNQTEQMKFSVKKLDILATYKHPGAVTIKYNEAAKRIECCASDENVRPLMVQSRCESMSDCEMRHHFIQDKPCSKKCLENMYVKGKNNCAAYQLGNYSDSGYIQCSWPKDNFTDTDPENAINCSEIVEEAKYFQFSYADGNFITDFHKLPALDTILKVFKESPSQNGTGLYACHANNFFFSHGLIWALKSKTGQLTFVPEEQFPAKHELQVNEDVNEAILCFAPVWNSATEWKNVSLKITPSD